MRSTTSTKGSVLIVALIFSAILAISITSYLKLALHGGKIANRAFHFNAAQNLVDTGFEKVIWSLSDQRFNGAASWTSNNFTQGATTTEYYGTFPSTSASYTFSGGATGKVKVWTTVVNPTDPPANYIWKAVAEATITLGDNTTVRKMAECYLRQRSFFDKGMVAREGITFTGQGAMVDSWISRPTPAQDIPYSTNVGIRRANATVAGLNFISLQNGDIYGYAAIGGTTLITTGQQANFSNQNNGTLNDLAHPGVVDYARVSVNFAANFPEVKPIPSGGPVLGAITGPTPPVLMAGNQSADSIDLQNSEILEVAPNVDAVLVVNGNVRLNGSASINIPPGSSLKLYIDGTFDMIGQSASILNGTTSVPSNPDRCQIFGMGTTARTWNFNGNTSSYISAAVYAPYANIGMSGGGQAYGAMVGNTFTLGGNGSFHQDESLANLRSSGIWGLSKWRELITEADRATYAARFAAF